MQATVFGVAPIPIVWDPYKDWVAGWGFGSVVERLPRKRKVMGSIPSSEKKEKKKKTELHICYIFVQSLPPTCVCPLVGGSVSESLKHPRLVASVISVEFLTPLGLSIPQLFHRSPWAPSNVCLWSLCLSESAARWILSEDNQARLLSASLTEYH